MKSTYQIETSNPVEKKVTLAALMAMGFDKGSKCSLDELIEFLVGFDTIVIYTENKTLSGNYTPHEYCGPSTTLTEFIKEFTTYISVEVILNDKYTAIVSKDGIRVACQTFPLNIVEKLAAAVKEITA